MKFYKVFSVEEGELYSAFEKGRTRLHYKKGGAMTDPKPYGDDSPGLMVLAGLEGAMRFLNLCGGCGIVYALYEVTPEGKMTLYFTGCSSPPEWEWTEGYVDTVEVGKFIAERTAGK